MKIRKYGVGGAREKLPRRRDLKEEEEKETDHAKVHDDVQHQFPYILRAGFFSEPRINGWRQIYIFAEFAVGHRLNALAVLYGWNIV